MRRTPLLTRGAVLCNSVLDCTADSDNKARRRRVDLLQTARQVVDLLAPSAPKDFSFDITQNSAGCALADADDVFRILFNLMNNSVSVARHKANAMKSVTIRVDVEGTTVTVLLSDDGPGLPTGVRVGLFRKSSSQSRLPRQGYGLAIARARGAKRRHPNACPFGQRRQLRIEVPSPRFGSPAGWATRSWPRGSLVVDRAQGPTRQTHDRHCSPAEVEHGYPLRSWAPAALFHEAAALLPALRVSASATALYWAAV